jgi:molybdopterin molybdotransferase
MLFHKVLQKPGKPVWFGMSRKHQPVFALPGNPVSTLVCLHRYVLPQLGCDAEPVQASLATAVAPHPTLTLFLPVRAMRDAKRFLVSPERYGGSGDLVALSGSDGFIEVPSARRKLNAGASVTYRAWT